MEKEKRTRGITDVLLILVITILAGTVLILACGASPMEAYGLFFRGIFGTPAGFAEIFVKACPLILTGLGCAVAYRTGFFNIGAEGQFYVGAMATTMVALNWTAVPGIPRIILSLVIGFLAGGVWALIAAVCKAKFNISEIIVTIMLNYIAINFLGYAVRSFLMDPEGNVPQSAKIDKAVQLGTLIRATRFHAGILIAIICVLVVWFFLEKTTMGYELKAVGLNKRGSTCNGISVMKNIVLSAFLSGGLSAVAGGIEVLAIQKKLLEGISSNCGYTAVLIALVAFTNWTFANKKRSGAGTDSYPDAKGLYLALRTGGGDNPIGVFFVAVLYAAMQVGASSMQRQLGVPSAIVNILIGLVVVLILGRELFHFKKKQAKVGKGGNA